MGNVHPVLPWIIGGLGLLSLKCISCGWNPIVGNPEVHWGSSRPCFLWPFGRPVLAQMALWPLGPGMYLVESAVVQTSVGQAGLGGLLRAFSFITSRSSTRKFRRAKDSSISKDWNPVFQIWAILCSFSCFGSMRVEFRFCLFQSVCDGTVSDLLISRLVNECWNHSSEFSYLFPGLGFCRGRNRPCWLVPSSWIIGGFPLSWSVSDSLRWFVLWSRYPFRPLGGGNSLRLG